MEKIRVKSVKVTGLQEMFDYEIAFAEGADTIILIAPNGYGKTAFLALLNSCLQFQLMEAGEHSFARLDVTFEDKSRWSFGKLQPTSDESADWQNERYIRMHRRRLRRRQPLVQVDFYDEKGRQRKTKDVLGLDKIPPDILAEAIDMTMTLPVNREGADKFKDLVRGDTVSLQQLVVRYKQVLLTDSDFREYIARINPGLFHAYDSHFNCVFIETQRLLFTRKSRPGPDSAKESEEEILRQAQHLATLLQTTYANYASTSQSLDRSFPNRLIARSEGTCPRETRSLRSDLNAIEARRRALTEAGILVEDAEHVIAPKDEFLPNVADALTIYVEDSKKKLATFDEIYPKVAVFRDLMSKKLFPKELTISRDKGAEVRRAKDILKLDRLSSGEKHEFIMLFRLIFETPLNSMVLIDEPEISLHVAWQLEFMSDLQRIQNVNRFQSIIATHSPQVIQGAEDIVWDLAEQVQ